MSNPTSLRHAATRPPSTASLGPVCPDCRSDAGLPAQQGEILVDISGCPSGRSPPSGICFLPASARDPGSWILFCKEGVCGRHIRRRWYVIALVPAPKDVRRAGDVVRRMKGYGWSPAFEDARGEAWAVGIPEARRAFEDVLDSIEADTRIVSVDDADAMARRRQCAIDRRAIDEGVYIFAAIDAFRPG
jgi:hypothetical protein